METTSNVLIGKFFRSKSEGGEWKWQGKVIGSPVECWYLVQLYDWMLGLPDVQQLVPLMDMVDWSFYDAGGMEIERTGPPPTYSLN